MKPKILIHHFVIFSDLRIQMFHILHRYHPLSLNILLYGESLLNDTDNDVFLAVQTYIKDTHKF